MAVGLGVRLGIVSLRLSSSCWPLDLVGLAVWGDGFTVAHACWQSTWPCTRRATTKRGRAAPHGRWPGRQALRHQSAPRQQLLACFGPCCPCRLGWLFHVSRVHIMLVASSALHPASHKQEKQGSTAWPLDWASGFASLVCASAAAAGLLWALLSLPSGVPGPSAAGAAPVLAFAAAGCSDAWASGISDAPSGFAWCCAEPGSGAGLAALAMRGMKAWNIMWGPITLVCRHSVNCWVVLHACSVLGLWAISCMLLAARIAISHRFSWLPRLY